MEEESINYNDEPVYYCSNCLSLKIKTVKYGMDLDYCDECGATDITQTHIHRWVRLYKGRYGFDYITRKHKGNGRERN